MIVQLHLRKGPDGVPSRRPYNRGLHGRHLPHSALEMPAKPPEHCRLLILGSGPAGYSAAVYAARANLKPGALTGLAPGGQLMTTTDVDNWPADAERRAGSRADGALPEARRAVRDRDRVRPDPARRPARHARCGSKATAATYTCDALIIATGASARYLGLRVGAEVHGQGRVGVRDLRRLLLPRPGRRRGRRRAIPRSRRRSTSRTSRATSR